MSEEKDCSSQSQPVFAPKSATREAEPSAAAGLTYADLKRLAKRYPALLCYAEPGGCVADDETNDVVCQTGGCAIALAFRAGVDFALSSEVLNAKAAPKASPLGASEAKPREDH